MNERGKRPPERRFNGLSRTDLDPAIAGIAAFASQPLAWNESEFYRTLAEWQARPFDFGTANCVHFASDIAKCWGIEFAVPDCETVEDAAEWIREQGVKSLYAYLVKLFGNPKPPLQAKRGFIAYRKGLGLEGSAVGAIDRTALFVGDRGLIQLPLSKIAFAFDPGRWRGGVLREKQSQK